MRWRDHEDDEDARDPVEAELRRRRSRPGALEFLHGRWVDEMRRSTMYVDARTSPPRVVYCSGGDEALTGVYEDWYFDGRQYYAKFRWLNGSFAGYLVLQVERHDTMNGGWWYDRDVKERDVSRLPFVAGMQPCFWVRSSDHKVWPEWAAAGLGMPGREVTADSLLREPAPATVSVTKTPGSVRVALADTAELRYRDRLSLWTGRVGVRSRLAGALGHRAWWLLHNLVAHPLLALRPGRAAVALHDWTSRGLNRDPSLAPSLPPQIGERLWWVVHNLVAHPAIAVAPCAATFRWHDATARRMRVRGWV